MTIAIIRTLKTGASVNSALYGKFCWLLKVGIIIITWVSRLPQSLHTVGKGF
jgi:hypothetical protein